MASTPPVIPNLPEPHARYAKARSLIQTGNYRYAVEMLAALADEGYVDALPLLSFAYRTGGKGTDIDMVKAFAYADLAMAAGHPDGYLYTALHNLHGLGVPRDPELALALYEAVWNKHAHRIAALCLGRINEFGLAGEVDLDKAISYYRHAQSAGVAIATRRIATAMWKQRRYLTSALMHVKATFVGLFLYRRHGESVFRRW